MRDSVTVILTIHNQENIVEMVLKGIFDHISENVKEIIIILDGCTDNTKLKVDDFLKNVKDISVRIIETPDLNEVKANNVGLKNCNTKYAILIQDDCVIREPNFDKTMLEPFKNVENVFIVSGRDSSDVKIVNESAEFYNLAGRDANSPKGVFYIRDIANRTPYMMDMDKAKELNYFDEDFAPLTQDDTDICLRAYRKGWIVGAYPIDYDSEYYWSHTRRNFAKGMLRDNIEARNLKMIAERHSDLINAPKHGKDIKIKGEKLMNIEIENNWRPLVSVLIPTYNRKWLLSRAIQSVLTQSYKNVEVIVVNDAGEDVQDVIDTFHDSRIKYFQNEKNLDLAGTRNVALKNSTGDYICLLDDDDIHLPYTLEFRMSMIKLLKADIVYTRALQDIWEKRDNGYVSVHKQLYWDSAFNRDLILIQNIAPCCCPLFSRRAWEESGSPLFDETLTTSEDWDFWVRLSRKFDFTELKLVDCECSFRTDKTQMTGSREGYTTHLPYLYKKWRAFAENPDFVREHQNNSLKARGLKPEIYDL